jgi:hypothetical protein
MHPLRTRFVSREPRGWVRSGTSAIPQCPLYSPDGGRESMDRMIESARTAGWLLGRSPARRPMREMRLFAARQGPVPPVFRLQRQKGARSDKAQPCSRPASIGRGVSITSNVAISAPVRLAPLARELARSLAVDASRYDAVSGTESPSRSGKCKKAKERHRAKVDSLLGCNCSKSLNAGSMTLQERTTLRKRSSCPGTIP